ncbi:MAG: T9SS type A sorting domain-containing protein [Saprospiraceae bacterium]|nr:T9SS type A sorting domain-containing protein [Saprospiraceae bacterium]
MKKISPLLALLLGAWLSLPAQTLPDLDIPVTSRNYFEICQQLDAWFAEEFDHEKAAEACEDNTYVKYQRWKWYWRDRVKPDGTFPDLRAQWLEHQKHMIAGVQNRDDQPVWKNEGPSKNPNSGYWGMGRTKNIAFHPSDPLTFFVGTPWGGFWRTTDGGANWTPMGDGLPYLPVSVILINHQNPDTMYISLGDKGGWWHWNLGVYRSTDGGFTWSPTGLDWELSQENVIYNLIMSPENPQILFAATNRGIRRTTDGGESWQTLRNGEYTDIKFRTGDVNTIYAAHHNYWGTSQVVKSTDGGDTWTQITDFQVSQNDIRLQVSPLQPDWLGVHFSNGKRFLLSKDGGVTYANNAAPEDDWGIFSFSPSDSNIVYLAGVSVSRSLDQGATWEKITHWYNDGIHAEVHADAHDMVHSPHNSQELWYCNDGGIYRYDETTQDWTDLSDGLGIAQFYRIAISEAGQLKIAAGSQDNGGWLRTPFGWRHTNGGDAMCQIIDPTNNNIIFTEYYGGNDIYRSLNGYATDENIADNIPGNPSGEWVTPFILNPQNPRSFLVAFEDVFRSFDRGDHFHKISNNLTGGADNDLRDIAMSASDTNIIVVTRQNRVYRTVNDGQNWNVKTVSNATEDITRIAIHPTDPERMWVTKSGYAAGRKVFSTSNAWQSTQNISGNLPNVPANCILFDSLTNYLLVGTDIGVFYSDADSINWKAYGVGMPAVQVLDLKIRQATRKLYAGTHGRGVYSIDLQTLVGADQPVYQMLDARIFPNPADHVVLFKADANTLFEGALVLCDATGRAVMRKKVARQSLADVVLDVAALTPGFYFLQAVDNEGRTLLREKLVVE